MPERPRRVAVLYNVDYAIDVDDDASTVGASTDVDASSVAQAAVAVHRALKATGHAADLFGISGLDVFDVLACVREARPDLVFNLCESMAGEPRNEPTFAGLLELFDIPFTGADLLGLASCLHKQRAKEILIAQGVATPPYRLLDGFDALADPALDALDYPWFVKLAHEDASVGITEANRVTTPGELRARAGELMAEHRQPVLAERYVDGREINVALIGSGRDVRVLPLHEIDFAAMPPDRPHIISYAAKWDEHHVDYAGTKPVPLRDAPPALIAATEATALAAWRALGLRDYGRVDLRIDAAGVPWVIDVNPNCDLSPDAGLARSAAVAGLSYSELIQTIAAGAWQRVEAQRGRRP